VQEEIEKIKEKIENLRLQQERYYSHLESEDGTLKRLMAKTDEHLYNVEKDLRGKIFGNGTVGLIVEIDRLKEDNRRLKIIEDKRELEIKHLNEYIAQQKGSLKVLLWLGGICTTILVGIVIALLTGGK
jgi:hypothetical protein